MRGNCPRFVSLLIRKDVHGNILTFAHRAADKGAITYGATFGIEFFWLYGQARLNGDHFFY